MKAGFSVLDQGIVSGANFILNVLLARWLSPAEYGAFAVAFSIFLFLSGFHNALILEPSAVLGPAHNVNHFAEYFGNLVWIHAGLTLVLSILVTIGGLIVEDNSLKDALLTLALAMPLILLFWLFRRAFYVRTRPESATMVSIVYAAALLAGILGLWQYGRLSSVTAFAAMGIASVMACAAGWNRLGAQKRNAPANSDSLGVASVVAEHWQYGKWVAAATVLTLGASQIQTFLVAWFLGLEAAGILRAMQTFMLPVAQAITAIAILALPVLSHEFRRGNIRAFRQKGLFITLGITSMAAAYELALVVFTGPVERILYGAKFADSAWLIPILGLVPVFTALATGYSLMLRAAQKPKHYVISGAVTAAVGTVTAVPIIWIWGVGGAAMSTALTCAGTALATYCLCRAWVFSGSARSQD
ncbi:MAG: oligosaccharide flippase family protein [Chloroflexi bacterium]|nr:oligosaccharide flippase family protein [Chloroflexota bacterium]